MFVENGRKNTKIKKNKTSGVVETEGDKPSLILIFRPSSASEMSAIKMSTRVVPWLASVITKVHGGGCRIWQDISHLNITSRLDLARSVLPVDIALPKK